MKTESSRGSTDRFSSKSPTRPNSSIHRGGRAGGGVRGATTKHSPHNNSRGQRGESPASPGRHRPQLSSAESGDAAVPAGFSGGNGHDAFMTGRSGRKQQLRGAAARRKADAGGGEKKQDGAAPLPAFDELSRWKVTRGSVPRMVRLAGEVSSRNPTVVQTVFVRSIVGLSLCLSLTANRSPDSPTPT